MESFSITAEEAMMKGHFLFKITNSGLNLAWNFFFLFFFFRKKLLLAGPAEMRILGKLCLRKVGIQIALLRLGRITQKQVPEQNITWKHANKNCRGLQTGSYPVMFMLAGIVLWVVKLPEHSPLDLPAWKHHYLLTALSEGIIHLCVFLPFFSPKTSLTLQIKNGPMSN